MKRSSFVDQNGTKKLYILGTSIASAVQEAVAQGWIWRRTVREFKVRIPTTDNPSIEIPHPDGFAVAELERPISAHLGDYPGFAEEEEC